MNTPIALRTDRLRMHRERRGWSQRELARRCGLGEAQINKYENGQVDPSSTFLKRIADELEISTDYLLGSVDEPRGHFGDGQIDDDEQNILNLYRSEGWQGVARLSVEHLSK